MTSSIRLFSQSLLPAVCCAILGISSSAQAASFDCGKASTRTEKAICANRSLSEMDVKMATQFEIYNHLVVMGSRGAMQDRQLIWLAERNLCNSNRRCLALSYRQRIGEIEQALNAVYQRGPF